MTRLIACEIQRISTPPVVVRNVPVANRSGATYALADGRKWVRKRALAIGEYGILAEALGWLMSKQLGLPVPEAAAYVPGEYEKDCWLSEVVRHVQHWSADTVPVQNISELGGILALDVLLMNEDRHDGNILLEPRIEQGEEVWRLWGIDIESATAGLVEPFVELGDDIPDIGQLPDDLPFEILRGPALETAREIAGWERPFIKSVVVEACSVASIDAASALCRALEERCRRAPSLVERYFDELMDTT